jgi:hypothetical protein
MVLLRVAQLPPICSNIPFSFEVNGEWQPGEFDLHGLLKAFDRVRHCLLLDRMSSDIEPGRCQWLGSYFSGRI